MTNIDTLKKMQSVLDELWAKSPSITGNWDDYENWRKAENRIEEEIWAIDKAAGEGVKVGRVMRVPHADGYALYWIINVNRSHAQVQWLPLGDAWDSPMVPQNNKIALSTMKRFVR